MGGKTLVLSSYNYSNGSNEQFNIETLKYFISNIKLTNTKVKSIPYRKKDAYFLVDASKQASLFPTVKVPEGKYQKLEFTLDWI